MDCLITCVIRQILKKQRLISLKIGHFLVYNSTALRQNYIQCKKNSLQTFIALGLEDFYLFYAEIHLIQI